MNNMRTSKHIAAKAMACLLSVMMVLLYVPTNMGDVASASETATPSTTAQPAGKAASVSDSSGATTYYNTFTDAIAHAKANDTVSLLADYTSPATPSSSPAMTIDKPLTIEGNGHTITTHGRGLYLTGGTSEGNTFAYTFKNIHIDNPDSYGRALSLRNGYKTLTLDGVSISTTGTGNTQGLTVGGNTPQTTSITIANSTLEASAGGYAVITFNPVDMDITDSTLSGYAAIYMKGPDSSAGSSNSTVNLNEGTVLSGKGVAGPTDQFGTFVVQESDNVKLNSNGATIIAAASDEQPITDHYAIYFSQRGAPSSNTAVLSGDTKVKTTGEGGKLTSANGTGNKVSITGGTYELEGGIGVEKTDAPSTSIEITGGTYSTPSFGEFIPDDKSVVADQNGKFTLADTDTVADKYAGSIDMDGVKVWYPTRTALDGAAKDSGNAPAYTTRTATFLDKDGKVLATVDVDTGSAIPQEKIPTLPKEQMSYVENGKQYTFKGWNPSPYDAVVDNIDIVPTYDEAPTPAAYTLTFVNSITKEAMSKIEVAAGQSISAADVPTPASPMEYEGKKYEFTGWNEQPVGAVANSDMVFFAQYKEMSADTPGTDDEGTNQNPPVGDETDNGAHDSESASPSNSNSNVGGMHSNINDKSPQHKASVLYQTGDDAGLVIPILGFLVLASLAVIVICQRNRRH